MTATTPSSRWLENGQPDPHGTRYNVERAALTLGTLTDDELANDVFMHGNDRPPLQDVLAGKAFLPIVYLTAAKDRIRWLSRALEAAQHTEAKDILRVYDFMGIGSQARSIETLLTNIGNMGRFTDYLWAIERAFFTVPGQPDEEDPDGEPGTECLLNSWGARSPEDYVEQFRAAIPHLIGAEFQRCHATEAHPRDVDTLLEALNCTLKAHGFKVVDMEQDKPDMFWNHDDPEQCQDSIHNVVVSAYENGCNVGDVVEVQQAIRLHNIKVRIIADPEDSEEISYEVVEDTAS